MKYIFEYRYMCITHIYFTAKSNEIRYMELETHPLFMIGRNNIVKMKILAKTIVQIQRSFYKNIQDNY